MGRLEEIRQRTEAGGPIRRIDMKYLLSEVAELTELLNASKAGQLTLQKAWEQDKDELTARAEAAEADKDGRCVVLPCKVGDICYEVDPGHPGVIKHTVTGTTVYNRRADGNRYMTDFVNVITIETYAVAEDGCEWADQYTAKEWADAPKTRAEAEAAMKGGGD